MKRSIAFFIGSRTRAPLIALTLLPFAVACSDRFPTSPQSGTEKGRVSSATPISVGDHRPATRRVSPRGTGTPLPAGLWGGDQAELTVSADGASVKLLCAHGAVVQPILHDDSGHFSVGGWLRREGGPVPIDDTPFRLPALYSGWTDGQTIIFTVTVQGFSQRLGPFKVVKGQKSLLGPCLAV
jgi:hypothetical protein